MTLPQWIRDLLSVVYPELCEVCGCALTDGEQTICLQCFADMPRTGIHASAFNEIHRRTAHKTRIERAGAYFHYERHSPYARLIHSAKYQSRPHIARELAEAYASEIMATGFFDGIELIEPVPLHHVRQLKRGYNQSQYIAEGINRITGIPVGNHLHAGRLQRSQTRRSAEARHRAAEGLYQVSDATALEGRHILIVDDVITTGATVAACCNAIAGSCRSVRLSLLSLGLSREA